jgi:hypothetical protein
VVKNFVKAFRSFVHCVVENEYLKEIKNLGSDEELEKFRDEFENWIKNSLLIEIMTNKYRECFEFFIQERAHSWIQNSKIIKKLSHFHALKEY